jgi:signal transduction histidine kinase/ActR/RegA family two-component response regulator
MWFDGFYPPDTNHETRRRVTLHVTLSLIGIAFLVVFCLIAYFQRNYVLSIADFITAAILAGNLFDLRRRHQYRFNIVLGLTFVSILFIYLYLTGGISQSAHVWCFTYPLIACYLLGALRGLIATGLMLIPVIANVLFGENYAFTANYGLNLELRFIAAYVVVGFFAYVFERHGERNRRVLKEINDSLELIVQRRTSELTEKNRQLKAEIEERIQAENKVRLSQDIMATIMNSIDSTIYVADKETCELLFVNDYMRAFIGADFSGKVCREVIHNSHSPCRECLSRISFFSETKQTEYGIWEGVNPITQKWSINALRIIKWVNGRDAFLNISTDTSHLKALQDEREKMEAQLHRAQKMEALGALAGGVAHDLNNVLSGIVSYPELLLLKLDETNPMQQPLNEIKKAGQKAADIVQDLLTLARRGVRTVKVFNLNDIIQDYLDSPEFNNLMSYHHKIDLTTQLERTLLNMKGSPVHIRKTVMNLIVNAAEAQPDGGAITITTTNHNFDLPYGEDDRLHQGDYVALKIADTGIGISQTDRERIFEPFYTKKTMGRSGSGLGMAVVWGTVEDHNGFIEIHSEVNKGTTFTLYFPVTREQIEKDKVIPVEAYMGDGQTVLIVDDSQEQRDIAAGILATLNYVPILAVSGEEALSRIKTDSVDILLLDMIMESGMDGLETYQEIVRICPALKAVIASGFAETDRVKKVQQLGAGPFIKKPYTIESIGLAIKNELGKNNRDGS